MVLLKRILGQREVKELFFEMALLLTIPDFERRVTCACQILKYILLAAILQAYLPTLEAVARQCRVKSRTWEVSKGLEKVSSQLQSETRKRHFCPPYKLMMRTTQDG